MTKASTTPTTPSSLSVIDRYQLSRVLGRGGMGTVYLARDTLLDRQVALKVVHPQLLGANPERLIALFQREAKNLAGLNHPGIIQIFDYSGLYSTRLYLVMEFVDGRSLSQIARARGPLPSDLVARIGVATAGVLGYAHSRGVIHHDLKPDNILVTWDGVLKLTDFGISRRLVGREQTRSSAEILGTPAFMAPERMMGEAGDARSDVFSLAASLYRLASGQHLSEATHPVEVMRAIVGGDFPGIEEVAPDLDPSIAETIAHGLALDPSQRFPDAMAFGRSLAAAAGTPPPDREAIPRVAALGGPSPAAAPDIGTRETQAIEPTTAVRAAERKKAGQSGPTALFDAKATAETQLESPSDPEPGALPLLQGRFQLVEKVGRGAIGEVWRALDRLRDDETVAVKIFRPAQGASVDEFKAEFRQLATISHPNLISIRDFGLLEGKDALAFYTMDFVAGQTLRQVATEASPDQVYGLLVQVARALIFLHGATGRPHLDLKPENILVAHDEGDQPRVVLTDPGNLTEKLQSVQRGDRTSLPYAAPETLSGFGAGPAADLYALGVMAYELIGGRRPFLKSTSETLKAAHLHETPTDLRELRPDVPGPIADCIRMLLDKDPTRRPSTAEAWIRAVNQVVVPPYPVETQATHQGRISSGPFIGRGHQLETAVGAWREAIEPGSQSPHLLLVGGEPGVGKAFLLRELKRIVQLEGATVFEARRPSPDSPPLGPLLPLLTARRAALGEHHPVVKRHREGLDQVLRPNARKPEGAALESVALAELLLAEVHHPTLILIHQLHRADRTTLDVIGDLARQLTPLTALAGDSEEYAPPVFIAASIRPDLMDERTREAFDDLPGSRRLQLSPLTREEVGKMVEAMFGGQPLSPAKLSDLERVTGGNPREIKEVVFALLEKGDLVFSGGLWRLREGVDVPLPKSTEEAIHARLANLSAEERDVLEALCVYQDPVPVRVVDSMDPGAVTHAQSLIARALLERVSVGDEVCLRFSHERVREALLRDLPDRQRQSRHRAAAAWLEANRPTHAVVESLARHWRLGGRPDRALSFLEEAADRSRTAGDVERAIDWYRQALEILPNVGLGLLKRLEREAEILRNLGEAERTVGQLPEAEAHFRRLLEIGRDIEVSELVGVAYDRLAVTLIDAGQLEEAMECASERLDLAERQQDVRGQALALRLIGAVWHDMDGPQAGIADLRRALEVTGDDPELDDVRTKISLALSYSYSAQGQPAEGLSWALYGLTMARQAGMPEEEVGLLINASLAHYNLGQFEDAIAQAQRAAALAEMRGYRRNLALAIGNVGDTERLLGLYERASEHLKQALKETYRMGGGDQLVHRLVELADLEMDRGAPQAALPYLREAWRLEPTSKHPRTRVRTALCELRLRLWATPPNRSNDKSSADLLRDATAWSTALRDPGLVLRALTLVGTASADAAPEAAHATAMEALEMARRLPPPGLRLQLDLALGLVRLLRKVGEADAAQELARAVATEVEGIAATLSEASLVATYRNAPLAKRVLFEAAKKN